MDKIGEIVGTTHHICKSLNLFEKYMPKKTDGKTQEALFWRDVVNIYGLFCDCDRIQIKERENLFRLFKKYSLIGDRQYQNVKDFYNFISALRTWFCHNYDQDRYFSQRTKEILQKFLKEITNSGGEPSDLEEIDWALADAYIRKQFDEYLDLLADALNKIEVSPNREAITDEWCKLYAKALYHDRELLDNILAENYTYACMDLGIKPRRIRTKTMKMRLKLEKEGYSYLDIYKSIVDFADLTVAASELVRESIRGYHLEV